MTNVNEVRLAYDALVMTRRTVINEEKNAMIDRVEERMTPLDEEFSRLLHRAAGEGLSKMELRKATRIGNSPRFSELWSLVASTESTVKSSPVTVMADYEWVDDHTLIVSVGTDNEVWVRDVSWWVEELDGGESRKTPTFDLDITDQEHYAVVYRAVEAALTARDEESLK